MATSVIAQKWVLCQRAPRLFSVCSCNVEWAYEQTESKSQLVLPGGLKVFFSLFVFFKLMVAGKAITD